MASRQILMRSALMLMLVVLFCAFAGLKAGELIPYVSPGIKIGWDSNRGFTMGPKLGIGLADLDGCKFLNLTVGIKSFQSSSFNDTKFVFMDLQIGAWSKNDPLPAFGGGVGLLLSKENGEFYISPRTTVFLGFIVFPTLDFNFWNEGQISYEPGFELVLPIPLKKDDYFGLE